MLRIDLPDLPDITLLKPVKKFVHVQRHIVHGVFCVAEYGQPFPVIELQFAEGVAIQG